MGSLPVRQPLAVVHHRCNNCSQPGPAERCCLELVVDFRHCLSEGHMGLVDHCSRMNFVVGLCRRLTRE